VDERGDGESETRGVEEKDGPTQHQSLSHDGGGDGQIHRVADIAVKATDDQLLSWRNRCRCAQALEDEASKRIEEADRTNHDESSAEDSERKPISEVGRIPTSQQPRDEAGDDPRYED